MTKTITADTLRAAGARCCQLDEFIRRFPGGVTVENEEQAVVIAVSVAGVFDWRWLGDKLLSDDAWTDFDQARRAAKDMFEAPEVYDILAAAIFASTFWNDDD